MHSFIIFFVAAHDVYYYCFGPCEAFRMKYTSHIPQKKADVIVSLNKKDHEPRTQKSMEKWADAEAFQYRLLHKWEDSRPYCTYAMLHQTTVPASKAKLDMFTYPSGERAWKFTSMTNLILIEKPYPQLYNSLALKFNEAIRLYSSVVPATLLSDIRKNVTAQIAQMEMEKMSETMRDVLSSSYKLLGKLSDMEATYPKNVKKEIQQNAFCYEHLKVALSELGFLPKATIDHCDICVFGKSLMDLHFYKDCGTTVKSAIIKQLKYSDDLVGYNNEGVVGGVAEFKNVETDVCRYGKGQFSIGI